MRMASHTATVLAFKSCCGRTLPVRNLSTTISLCTCHGHLGGHTLRVMGMGGLGVGNGDGRSRMRDGGEEWGGHGTLPELEYDRRGSRRHSHYHKSARGRAPSLAPSLARSLDRAACSTLFCAPPSRSVPRTRSDPSRSHIAVTRWRAQVAEIKRRLSQKLPCVIRSRPPVAVCACAPACPNERTRCARVLSSLCVRRVVDAPPVRRVCLPLLYS